MNRELKYWIRMKEYPRDFAIKKGGDIRRELVSHKSFVEKYEKYGLYTDTYASVFSEKEKKYGMFDTIFLDIDIEKFEGYEAVKYVVRELKKNGIYPSRVYFSGRGYHIYIDLDDFLFLNRAEYSYLVKSMVKDIGIYDFLDSKVLGDISRLARLPYTLNTKTGLFVVRVNIEKMVWKEIEDSSRRRYNEDFEIELNEVGKFDKWIKHIDEKDSFKNGEIYVDEFFIKHKYDEDSFPDCVKHTMYKVRHGIGTSHYERLQLANFLILLGWSDDEIVEVFRNADDFKESITRYQIDYSRKRKLNVFSCKRGLEEGFCTDEEYRRCPFKPLSSWLRWK